MNFTVQHAITVVHFLQIEGLDQQDKNKVNKSYKLVQQIQLYFEKTDAGVLQPRNRESIAKTTFMFRIIANLRLWGAHSKFRFRCIAVFYASLYIRELKAEVDSLTAEDWHMHFFRKYYTKQFDNKTFFGLTLSEASVRYSMADLAFVGSWETDIKQRLDVFIKSIDQQPMDFLAISRLHAKLYESVSDEATLFAWAVRHWGSESKGVNGLLWYLMYNIKDDPSAKLLRIRAQRFKKAITSVLEDEPTPSQRLQDEKDKKKSVAYRTRSRMLRLEPA